MKRSLLIVIFLTITLFMALLVFLSFQPKRQLQPTPTPAKKTQEQIKAEFLAKLPITSQDFVIGYNPSVSKVVAVEILAKSKKEFLEKKLKAATFIKNFGIEDLCSLQVRFIPVEKTVKEKISEVDIFAEGCPLPT